MDCVIIGADAHTLAIAVAAASAGYHPVMLDERGATSAGAGPTLAYAGRLGAGEVRLARRPDLASPTEAAVIVVGTELRDRAAVADRLAPSLSTEHVVLLSPGGVGGALAFVERVHAARGVRPVVAEVPGFPFVARFDERQRLQVAAVKDRLPLGVFPARRLDDIYPLLRSILPSLTPATSVLETSLKNTNTLIHPPITLLNAARVERGERFRFYREGLTPGAERIVEVVDVERRALAHALGIDTTPIADVMAQFYGDQGMTGNTIFEQLAGFEPFASSLGPQTLAHRYVTDDIPYGLAPMAALGRQLGVSMPITTALVALWSTVCGQDLWTAGNTPDRMGIAGMSRQRLLDYVANGR